LAESIGKAYKPWLLVSLTVLVGGLLLLVVAGTVAFLEFSGTMTPLWVIVIGVLGAFGLGLGFAGFFLMMMLAGWHSFREARRVQILPPGRS
jgi:hypothetical protein